MVLFDPGALLQQYRSTPATYGQAEVFPHPYNADGRDTSRKYSDLICLGENSVTLYQQIWALLLQNEYPKTQCIFFPGAGKNTGLQGKAAKYGKKL